jgi:Tfp pilus assembly PilM family ATPase
MRSLKQCLGVDLGFNSVKIVELAIDRNGVRTVRAASAPTGATPNMTTEEVNQAIISTAREVIKKGRFSSKNAIFSISGQKVFVRRFTLPGATPERLERMIQFEARQQIPFPIDRTILQYQYKPVPGENEVEVLLVAIRTDEVKSFMQLISKTGLKPLMVSVSSFALFNAEQFLKTAPEDLGKHYELFKAKEKPKKAAGGKKKGGFKLSLKKGKKADSEPLEEVLVEEELSQEEEFAFQEVIGHINIGATSYDLAVGDSSIKFIRTVPVGGNQMSLAIQRACNVESFNDAERIKSSATQLMTFSFDFDEESQLNQEASMAVTEVADKIVSDIRLSLDFFITQPDGMAVDSIVLAGGQAQLPGFAEYLEEKLTVPVTVMAPPQEGGSFQWQEAAGALSPYSIAIGLALQGLSLSAVTVDFLPEEQKITRDFPYKVAAVMLIILGAIIGIASQAGKDYSAKYDREVGRLQADLNRKKQQIQRYNQAQSLHSEVATDFVDFEKSFGQRDYWMDILAALTEAKPAGAILVDVSMDHGGIVELLGESNVQVDAALFAEGIQSLFEERIKKKGAQVVGMITIPAPQGGGEERYQFIINFALKDKFNHLKITPTPSPTPVKNNRAGRGGIGMGMTNPMMGGMGVQDPNSQPARQSARGRGSRARR